MWKNTNGLKFCHWKIHFLGVQSYFSPKVLLHRIFSSPNAPFKIWAVYPRFTWWHDVSLSPSVPSGTEQKSAKKKKKKKKSELTTFRNFLQHDMTFCYPPPPLFSHTLKIDDGMIGLIDLVLFSTRSHFVKHIGGVTIFNVGGGGKFFEVKNGASVPAVALARRRECLRGDVPPQKLELFWKYRLKWSYLVHYFSSC